MKWVNEEKKVVQHKKNDVNIDIVDKGEEIGKTR